MLREMIQMGRPSRKQSVKMPKTALVVIITSLAAAETHFVPGVWGGSHRSLLSVYYQQVFSARISSGEANSRDRLALQQLVKKADNRLYNGETCDTVDEIQVKLFKRWLDVYPECRRGRPTVFTQSG